MGKTAKKQMKNAVNKITKTVLKGKGAYTPELANASNKDIAKEVGSRGVGWIWDTLFGSGAYATHKKARNNSLMSKITANGPPTMHSNGNKQVRIMHREALGDVTTGLAGEFLLRSFPLNPGDPTTFPWLSKIAENFQQYRIHGLVFEFLSTSANALSSTNTALGQVIMATAYNSAEPPFRSKTEMENTEFVSIARQSQSMLHPVECKPSLTSVDVLYIRDSTEIPDNQDVRLYDLGNFQIATVGQQGDDVVIGELWVSYDIELLKPTVVDLSESKSNHYEIDTNGTTPLNNLDVVDPENNLNVVIVTNSGTRQSQIKLPDAVENELYLIMYDIEASSPASYSGMTVTTSLCTLLLNFPENGPIATLTGTVGRVSNVFLVRIGDTSDAIAVITLTSLSSQYDGSGDLTITKLNSRLSDVLMPRLTEFKPDLRKRPRTVRTMVPSKMEQLRNMEGKPCKPLTLGLELADTASCVKTEGTSLREIAKQRAEALGKDWFALNPNQQGKVLSLLEATPNLNPEVLVRYIKSE